MRKFEVGKTYISTSGHKKITISKRTEKTIWFCDGMFYARIKINENGNEYASPNIGFITPCYKA